MQSKQTRILLIGGALLLGGATVSALRAGRRLETEVLGRFGGIDGDYVKLIAEIRLTNPTATPLHLSYPYLKISIEGLKLAENRIRDQRIRLGANTTLRLSDELGEDIVLHIPYQTAVAVLGPSLGRILAGTGSVGASVEVSTQVSAPGLPAIPVRVSETMNLSA